MFGKQIKESILNKQISLKALATFPFILIVFNTLHHNNSLL